MPELQFIVEFLGPKGWEIGHEGDDASAALDYWTRTRVEGFPARITCYGKKLKRLTPAA